MPTEPLLKAHAGAHSRAANRTSSYSCGGMGCMLDTVALQCGQRSVNIARSARTTIMDS